MNNTRNILIDDIENSENKTLNVEFDEVVEEIKTKTPIKAFLQIKSLGDFIEVKGEVSTTLILECDRCLSEFEYELNFEIDEMYAKNALKEEYAQETELSENDFIIDLNGNKEIDIYDLLYQSVIINLPNKQVCGINCKEDEFETDENLEIADPRMEVFKKIKID